jgi:hypothetical protein
MDEKQQDVSMDDSSIEKDAILQDIKVKVHRKKNVLVVLTP